MGYLSLQFTATLHPLLAIGFADFVATLVIFVFSFFFKNSSIYDPYWSIIPILIAFYFMLISPEGNGTRQLVILLLVLFWGIRLTLNWARGWPGLHHQDWRYDDLSIKTGKFYWLVSFTGIHLLPTLLVFLGCIPILAAMQSSAPFGLLDFLAALVTFIAVVIELVADEQLKVFKKKKQDQSAVARNGLWAYSRHPNYFGEVLFWVGLFAFAIFLSPIANAWTALGALAMILLFVFISIPMMDKRGLSRKPGYAQYIKEVSGFLPWFKKR